MKKVLVADKDEESLELTLSRLSVRGYEVKTISDSVMAMKMAEEFLPDVILIDCKMEKLNGLDLASRIKESSQNAFTPIIMMTGKDDISGQIMGIYHGYNDFIVKPFTSLELQLRIELVLKGANSYIQANPLTKLPGNIAIECKIRERIENGGPFSVCYIDIDNFKSFNDKYGFTKGDDILIQTARILKQAALAVRGEVFVGHVGGDDFIVILSPDDEKVFVSMVIREFDRLIPTHYSEEDRRAGRIKVKNRRGKIETFPIATVSIAAVTNLNRKFTNIGEISEAAAGVKKFLKMQKGSNYLRDRREQQMETFEDFEDAMDLKTDVKLSLRSGSIPLGQMLVEENLISREELSEALRKHFKTGKRLGRILIEMGILTRDDVGRALEKKLGMKYLDLNNVEIPQKVKGFFSKKYMDAYGVLPYGLDEDNNILFLAMVNPFDNDVLEDIELNFSLKIEPAIILEDQLKEFLSEYAEI